MMRAQYLPFLMALSSLLLCWACATSSTPPPALVAETQPVAAIQVHLTIDDLPWMIEREHKIRESVDEIVSRNRQLIQRLSEHQVKASVFFNCGRIRPGDDSVQAWSEAGHTVGNHTWGHARLANVETEVWLKQARDCHEHLHEALGHEPVWFRYPHLCYGQDQAQRDQVTAGLAALGERNAPVTVATTEWLFAYVYRRALRTADLQLQQEVAAAWHSHMDASLQAGIEAAAELPGRAIPQTVLVHINELVIDELGVLIQRWTDQKIAFVDLETAMSDPVFAMDNQYSGQAGLSWLWRIRSREQYGSYWFGLEQGRVEQQFGAIDPLDKGEPQ